MNYVNAATGQAPTNQAKLRQLAKDTESVGCRLRRALDRGNGRQAERAIADLKALASRIEAV